MAFRTDSDKMCIRDRNEGMVRASKTVLNNLLSDHFVLLAKTWNYHWNVKGVSFHSYHVFMEDLYNGLIEDIDAIAERILSLIHI